MGVPWDATRYAERLPKKSTNRPSKTAKYTEDRLQKRFPPQTDLAAGKTLTRPCILVDMDSVILAWYLPGILDGSRQVSLLIFTYHYSTLMYFRAK